MSQIYNTGPCILYVGQGDSGELVELGFSEDGMRIAIRETFEDVHSDLLGPKIPTDVQRFQADALITGDLIRWNESVLELCEDRSAGDAGWGNVRIDEVGALMLAQGKTYRLLCDAPNVAFADAAFPDMTPYNFPEAYLHDTMERRRGARVERVHIIFRALANFSNFGMTAALPVSVPLYNSDRTGRPAASPN